ncbi:MAG: DUF1559 family PulG-like putative transporter [Planctomycetota bacterium]
MGRTDYAGNEGDYITDTRGGPASLREGDSGRYRWKDVSWASGIFFQRSEVRPAWVRDGLSRTYLIGEKYVTRADYLKSDDPGYDQSAFIDPQKSNVVRARASVPKKPGSRWSPSRH